MRKVILVFLFFALTPIALGASLFSLVVLEKADGGEGGQVLAASDSNNQFHRSGVSVYASLPSLTPSISGTANVSDARAALIKQYLASYNSLLEPYSDFIVETADQYNVDFRLITAIAQQESNLCKKIPAGTFNCWGWGIHSQGTLGFNSYEEGIETVTKGLREDYLNEGYETIEEIMSKYTPLSQGSWAQGVTAFMSQMQ